MNEHMSGHEAVSAGKHPSGEGTAADASAPVSSATHPGEASEPISDAEGAEGAQGVPDGSPLPAATSGEIRESGCGKTACRIAGRGLVLSIALGLLSIGVCLLTYLKGERPIDIEPPVPSRHPVFTDVCTAFEVIRRAVHRNPECASMLPGSDFYTDFLKDLPRDVDRRKAEEIRGAFAAVWRQTPPAARKTGSGFGNCLYWFWVSQDEINEKLIILAEPLDDNNGRLPWYSFCGYSRLSVGGDISKDCREVEIEKLADIKRYVYSDEMDFDSLFNLLRPKEVPSASILAALEGLRRPIFDYAREHNGIAPERSWLEKRWSGPFGRLDYVDDRGIVLRYLSADKKRCYALRVKVENSETGEPLTGARPYEAVLQQHQPIDGAVSIQMAPRAAGKENAVAKTIDAVDSSINGRTVDGNAELTSHESDVVGNGNSDAHIDLPLTEAEFGQVRDVVLGQIRGATDGRVPSSLRLSAMIEEALAGNRLLASKVRRYSWIILDQANDENNQVLLCFNRDGMSWLPVFMVGLHSTSGRISDGLPWKVSCMQYGVAKNTIPESLDKDFPAADVWRLKE